MDVELSFVSLYALIIDYNTNLFVANFSIKTNVAFIKS